MTAMDQSQATVHSLMRSHLLTAKTKTRLATWNDRTLFQTGKLAQLANEFDRCRLDILCVSEARLAGSEKVTIDSKTFVYSGHATDHVRGVAIMLSRQAASSLLGWCPVSDRIVSARLQGLHAKLTFIQAYAPTEDTADADKVSFYDDLTTELRRTPRHDLVILAGDFNAQIGPERQTFEHVIGPHGSAAATKDNGMRLMTFCATHGMAIGNTYFAHKKIHKATWKAPGAQDVRNEIDYICISKRWRSSLLDVHSYRAADVGTDHFLLGAACRIRLKRQFALAPRLKPFDVARLQDPAIANSTTLQSRSFRPAYPI
ncbi:craniofacial development protein 2-like [Clarias gariepinus]|uniref:craniofacial development protein 2-like n=1 Tax=Clarias gariepinus TaxID=13013 RepID=UPI00234C46D2|nr:craniofacial development protein 2-like [Clarias gariepinus]